MLNLLPKNFYIAAITNNSYFNQLKSHLMELELQLRKGEKKKFVSQNFLVLLETELNSMLE